MPPAHLYLRTLWRYTNDVIIIIIIKQLEDYVDSPISVDLRLATYFYCIYIFGAIDFTILKHVMYINYEENSDVLTPASCRWVWLKRR